jgi:molybdopterin/thiamine biosynthesis adenylyltransferase
MRRDAARALVVGVGGLGCPAALVLARAGIGTIGLCDDDVVELGNLHRQILFGEADVGATKLDAAARALGAMDLVGDGGAADADAARCVRVKLHATRLLPDNAIDLVSGYDVVLEGSDNFATKFLAADACRLAGVPVVHASAVRWIGTALAVGVRGRPCYRCLFEDVPDGDAPNCAEAGVVGPVVGLVAAAQADLALALVDGADGTSPRSVEGELVSVDGLAGEGALRRRTIAPRADCPLCGVERIRRIEAESYAHPICSA